MQVLGPSCDMSPLSSPIACLWPVSCCFPVSRGIREKFSLSNKRAIVSRSSGAGAGVSLLMWYCDGMGTADPAGQGGGIGKHPSQRERAFQLVAGSWVWQLRPDKLDGGDMYSAVYITVLYCDDLWPVQSAIWVIWCHILEKKQQIKVLLTILRISVDSGKTKAFFTVMWCASYSEIDKLDVLLLGWLLP